MLYENDDIYISNSCLLFECLNLHLFFQPYIMQVYRYYLQYKFIFNKTLHKKSLLVSGIFSTQVLLTWKMLFIGLIWLKLIGWILVTNKIYKFCIVNNIECCVFVLLVQVLWYNSISFLVFYICIYLYKSELFNWIYILIFYIVRKETS